MSRAGGQTTAPKRERTCISCGVKASKATLSRVVRTPEGEIRFDATGRAAGRGAYVCSEACLDAACKSRKLDRALKTKVTPEAYERVAAAAREAFVTKKGE